MFQNAAGIGPRKRSADREEDLQALKRPKISEAQTLATPSTLPPRLRRLCSRKAENITRKHLSLEGSVVSISLVTRSVMENDIREMLQEMGIQADFITRITVQREDAMATICFLDVNFAKQAFDALRRDRSNGVELNTTNETTSRTQIEVIDLTAASESENHTSAAVGCPTSDSHRGLDESGNEDSDESDSDSVNDQFSSNDIPSPTANEENREGTLEEYVLQQSSSSLGNFELMSLNSSVRELHKQHRPRQSSKRHCAPSRQQVPSPNKASTTPVAGVQVVAIPKAAYNQARRILIPSSAILPLVAVSMRADLQFFDRTSRYRLSKFSLPNDTVYKHVVDAAVVGDTTVITYDNGPCQVSLVRLIEDQFPSLTDIVSHNPHGNSSTKACNAVCCLARYGHTRNTVKFFTGGYDRSIRLWKVDTSEPTSATSEEVVKLSTIPEALAFRRNRRSLLTATSKRLLDLDLDHLSKKPEGFPMSNTIHQLHVDKHNENVVILEVDHRDFQIQIYDARRKPGFDRASDCCFGGRYGAPVKASKGDAHLTFFAKGYEDGTLAIWDFRNAKRPLLDKEYKSKGSIMHTAFLTKELVIGYGRNGLTYLDILGSHIN